MNGIDGDALINRLGEANGDAWRAVLAPELNELRKVMRHFLDVQSPETAVRSLMATEHGYDHAVWKQMAIELGVQGMIIPERLGGAGFGALEQAVVLEEMGRALLCSPYMATAVLAARALLESKDAAAMERYLPPIASGASVATVAFVERDGAWSNPVIHTNARQDTDGTWRLTGVKSYVLSGGEADLILVLANAQRPSLFAARAGTSHYAARPLQTLDRTRKLAEVTFNDSVVELVGSEGDGLKIISRVLDYASAAMAAEEIGGAQKCLEMASDYAKLRIQFGRSIGSFQAIKHKCAEMLVDIELARAAANYSAWCATESIDDLSIVAPLAEALSSEAFASAATENIQIHGGIGFTWEHPAHLYYRRAKSSELFLGDPAAQRLLLAERLGA